MYKIRYVVFRSGSLDAEYIRDEMVPFVAAKGDLLYFPANDENELGEFTVVRRIWIGSSHSRQREFVSVEIQVGNGLHIHGRYDLMRATGWKMCTNGSNFNDHEFKAVVISV